MAAHSDQSGLLATSLNTTIMQNAYALVYLTYSTLNLTKTDASGHDNHKQNGNSTHHAGHIEYDTAQN